VSIEPHVERTLLAVFIAEACFRRLLPITEVPPSRDLRLRFLGELLAPCERDDVLEQCGIPKTLAPSQKVDTRAISPQPAAQQPTAAENLPDLESFNMSALKSAFSTRPAGIDRVRCLRILQCVHEIGSPKILESLKLVLATRPDNWTSQTVDESIVEKLFQIHIYLDTQDSRSHILVARNRYIKFCYFETYQNAVQALQEKKHSSYLEHRRLAARKATESYKQGLVEELPPTPHTDDIRQLYQSLTPAEQKRRAPDMIKDEITRKVCKEKHGNEKRVRRDINRYIREGKALHFILQGEQCLSPGLLILFPSRETHPPSLDSSRFQPGLTKKEQESLDEPIEMNE
jgi:hypothetical protein